MSSDEATPMYFELKAQILDILRQLARSAKHKTELCSELLKLKRLISAVGGKQLPPERRDELRRLIQSALKQGGCV